MLAAARKAIDQAGLTVDDIACVIAHQANLRIIEAIGERLGIPREKVFVNVDRYGNTSAAAVAIALDEANRSGRIKSGDYVFFFSSRRRHTRLQGDWSSDVCSSD